jgi:hypothetical protein
MMVLWMTSIVSEMVHDSCQCTPVIRTRCSYFLKSRDAERAGPLLQGSVKAWRAWRALGRSIEMLRDSCQRTPVNGRAAAT